MYQYHLFLLIRNLLLFIVSFGAALIWAPFLIRYLYRRKAWKKKAREESSVDGTKTPLFNKLHAHKETNVPRMGGVLIWGTVLVVTLAATAVSYFFPDTFLGRMNFLSRSQTWLPLFTLISASILGLLDDLLVIQPEGKYSGGIQLRARLGLIFLIALVGAWWFYFKLGWSTIYIPFYGDLAINGFYLLLFVIVVMATFSSSVIDGLDGLSAGVLIPIFIAFGVIAYAKGLYDLVALLTVLVGAMVSFLWFNIHPAKFYMTETGIMGLTVTLAVVAFLTNSVFFLPIIGFVLVLESMSDILQVTWRKLFKRKLFLIAPIHHHFEAKGWPESQITMRFWILSAMCSALGLVIFFLARFL